MAVPKKRTSMSKKRIRKNIWKKRGYLVAVKAFSLAKSILTGDNKSYFTNMKAFSLSKSILTGNDKSGFTNIFDNYNQIPNNKALE